MKRIKIYLSSIIALMFLCGYQPIFACGHAYINGCGASVKVSVNGGASIEYGAGESSCWLQAFNNKNFGTVTSLDLTFAGQVTWESCLNNVMNGTMYYRVYKSNTTPGSFIAVPLSQFISTLQGDYTRKDRWVDTDLDFLQGLSQAGTYVVELYFKSQVDLSVCPNPWYPNVCTIGDGVADIDIFSNNSGQNYKATFTYGGGSSGTLTMNTTKTNVTCYGGNNGAATATASGGSSPYTYLWNNSATTGAITGLSAGTYSVTATDALGNVGFATLNITSPSQLNLTTTSTNETSSSANNGTASVTVSGGTSPYSGYSWSNGATTASINNLDSGTYTVTVTDASNCTASKSVFITVGTAPPPTYCASQGTPWTDWISNVTLSTINNNSGKANYTNYSNISTSLNAGSQYPISVSNSYSWTTYAEYVRVWIDYNINGTFDANEVVFEKFVDPVPPNGTVSSTLSGTFTVPATATEGATRMRVSLKRTGYATACETITYGEVEDYAIIITNGAPPACSVAASTTNILCNNNGTTTNSADDTFTFSMTVTGSNAGATGWTTTIAGQTVTGTYGTPKAMGPYPISGGNLSFTVRDATTSTCSTAVSVTAPATCSNGTTACSVAASTTNILCNNNGTTTNSADDTFTFSMTVTGSNAGATGWTTTIAGQTVTGTYGTPKAMGPYPISGGNLSFTVRDATTSTCSTAISVTAPATCSGTVGTGTVDLQLTLTATPPAPGQWQNVVYTATLLNKGTGTATGVTVKFPIATGLAYQSASTQKGTYDGWLGSWNVGSMAANETATLNVNLFTLQAALPIFLVQVQTASPADTDSTPGNNTTTTPTEDDEATTTNNTAGTRAASTVAFSAVASIHQTSLLTWANNIGQIVESYTLEKGTHWAEFQPITTVTNSFSDEALHELYYEDKTPTVGDNYYRIKYILHDGNYFYSPIQAVNIKATIKATVYPNPTDGESVFVQIDNDLDNEMTTYYIHNLLGNEVSSGNLQRLADEPTQIPVGDLDGGVYFITLVAKKGNKITNKLMINRL